MRLRDREFDSGRVGARERLIRKKEWFIVDNIYINGYAKLLSPLTALTYFALCRHANTETQECFPSIELIAEELNISKPTVIKAIKELEKWNIISVTRSKKSDGTQSNNIYVLLDKEVWKSKPSSIEQPSKNEPSKAILLGQSESISQYEPSKSDNKNRVNDVYHKETNINNTNIKNTSEHSSHIAQVIKEMESIDPKNKNYYGSKTQRKACEFLIQEYSYEKVIQMIQTIPKIKNIPYMPSVTTPCELRDKWQKIIDAAYLS